jgi:hypothetical protein
MSLLVPPEMAKSINSSSGFLVRSSSFGGKNLKGLFYTIENRKYLVDQLYSLLTNRDFVQDTISSIEKTLENDTLRTKAKQSVALIKLFTPIKPILVDRIQVLIEAWKLPNREDHAIHNPILELSLVNQEFLVTTAKTIIQSPDCIVTDYYDIDPNTLKVDAPEWDYGAASWADGTWHPEHLFTQSKRNRANVYWVPMNVTFDTNPPVGDDWKKYGDRPTAFHPRAQHYNPDRAKVALPTPAQKNVQLVNQQNRRERFTDGMPPISRAGISSISAINPKYRDIPNIQDLLEEQSYPYNGSDGFSKFYHVEDQVYAPGPGPGNRYRYDFYGQGGFSDGGTFPRWQYSVDDRPYQRDNSEGLREGGSSDRRTQRPSGYDMSALTTKSFY